MPIPYFTHHQASHQHERIAAQCIRDRIPSYRFDFEQMQPDLIVATLMLGVPNHERRHHNDVGIAPKIPRCRRCMRVGSAAALLLLRRARVPRCSRTHRLLDCRGGCARCAACDLAVSWLMSSAPKPPPAANLARDVWQQLAERA